MAPLSGKQQREYLKFQNKEAREVSKMGLDEMRKQQLHELKLQEAAAKANQGLGHKEQVNSAKLKDMGIPPARMNKQKLGIPTQNPLAGTGMFKQGQRSLAQAPIFQAQGTDTVPAMLTPGEAVIPRAAAQNPKNKKAIKRMVQEGRKANAMMDGTMAVPEFSRGSSAQANYADGTERVFSRYGKGPLKIVSTHDGYPQQYDEEGRGMSEYSVTVTDPRINKGRPTNIPSLWEGKVLSEDNAILKALANGGPYPSYKSIPQAIEAAGQKSDAGGAAASYMHGTYGVVPQQVQSAAGYDDGTENVSYLDRFLNYIGGQQIPVTQPVVAPLASNPSDFNTVIERVFQREYPNEAKAYHVVKGDKGGATKYGISQKAYPDLDIKNLTKEQAIEIAKRDYWDKNNIEKLDPSIREIYFDTAFNKGSGTAKKLFERSGGDPNKFLDERQKYVDQLVKNNPSQKKFQQGWSNRVNDLRKVAEAATDVIIPSAQAGTLDTRETQAPLGVAKPEVVNLVNNTPSGRDVLIAKQNLATSTDPKLIESSKDILARANQAIPTLADTRGAIINSPLTAMETPLFNKDQQDLIRLSEIINDPATTPNDKKWAYTEINRITRNGQPVSPVGAGTARSISNRVLGSELQANIANLPKNEPYSIPEVPVPTQTEVPKPIDVAINQQAMANDQDYNMSLGEGKQVEVPAVDGTGFSKQNVDKFNTLGVESRKELDNISQAVRQATQMQGTLEEKKGFLANILSGIFGPKGLFNDKDLIRFGILAAGGMLTGGSVGGSLRVAGLNTLQSADKRQAEQFASEQQDKRFAQQEDLLDKRFAKEREFRKEDLIRAEDKQLETEMIREGRDSVAVRNWIKGGQKGEVPAIKTSYIRNGNSELMTVTSAIKLNDQVFKPGDPVYVYQMTQQVGPRKGETIQMARIGNKDIPFEDLMSKGFYLSKWNESTHGEIAKLKRAQEFSEKLSKNIFDPIVESYFGASNVKGKANPERKGIVTAGSAASQVESYFRGKVDLDNRAVQNEIEKITTIASEQLVKDIESGTYKVSKDITPYLAAGEFRERGKLSDKLVTLDKKSGRIMSADDILALRDSANTFISKNKTNTTPDAEIARLAEVWTANSNGIQNKYKNSDRNTAFALFALDTFKK